jgi:hypothetical protein
MSNMVSGTPKVFIDTNVLLKGFVAHRAKARMPDCFTDPVALRYTFEKCVFEGYMAFRGVGGKKPDEGRNDWARRFLTAENDPLPLGSIISQYHDGDKELAHFWINQILEAQNGIKFWDHLLTRETDPQKQEQITQIIKGLQGLATERNRFEDLCWEFSEFLKIYNINRLAYAWVFNIKEYYTQPDIGDVGPDVLDGFVRDTVLPAEDFEIVYAALRIRANIFVTDDSRLRTCARSLGLNFPLSPTAFCSSDNYHQVVEEWRLSHLLPK